MKMREKAKELQRQRVESTKRGIKPSMGSSGGFGPSPMSASIPTELPKASYQPAAVVYVSHFRLLSKLAFLISLVFLFFKIRKPNGPSKALKLGGRLKDAENFVDQLKSEGEHVVNSYQAPSSINQGSSNSSAKLPPSTIATEPYSRAKFYPRPLEEINICPLVLFFNRIQLRVEEKLTLSCSRDGGLHNMEVHGLLTLFITDETYGRVRVQVCFVFVLTTHHLVLGDLTSHLYLGGKQRQPRGSNPDTPQRGQGTVPNQTVGRPQERHQALPVEHGRWCPQVALPDAGRKFDSSDQ